MNKDDAVKEMLKDALNYLKLTNELVGELATKDKVTAYIELSKAYVALATGFSSVYEEIAPPTVAETKKAKGSKKNKEKEQPVAVEEATAEAPTTEAPTHVAPVEETATETTTAETIPVFPETDEDVLPFDIAPTQVETPPESVTQVETAPTEQVAQVEAKAEEEEEPLISIIDGVWIKFNRSVIENGQDYSTWFQNFVNQTDDKGQSVGGVEWANNYVTAFTHGVCNSVQDITDENVMGYFDFIIRSIDANNAQA